MNRKLARMEFVLHWQSADALHHDGYYAPRVNFWRDILPADLAPLEQVAPGATRKIRLDHGDALPEYNQALVKTLRNEQFNRHALSHMTVEPRVGRYYPIGMLEGVPGFFRGDQNPARCLEQGGEKLRFDLNHPLARREVSLEATLLGLDQGSPEHGGACLDWIEQVAARGPGMQGRDGDVEVDILDDRPFERLDSNPDPLFYATTRLLPHIDSQASAHIAAIHARLLKPGQRVLDLMSSWQSHLPETLELEVVGLGMNEEELRANPRLDRFTTHDLNENPLLPYADGEFDAVICHLSVEYLTQPQAVFAEVARVLRTGGVFINTFSNRWFPPKAINIWHQLHEFERLGLVLDYYRHSGRFSNLETWSMRNYPRPEDDSYARQLAHSDPIYAVWGYQGA